MFSATLLTGVLDLEGTADVGVALRGGLERERDEGRDEEGERRPPDDDAFLPLLLPSVAALRNSEASVETRELLPVRTGGRCIVAMKKKEEEDARFSSEGKMKKKNSVRFLRR